MQNRFLRCAMTLLHNMIARCGLCVGLVGLIYASEQHAYAEAQTAKPSSDLVKCAVRLIAATQKEGGLDERLKLLQKQLSQPPFSAFRSLKLLEMRDLDVPLTKLQELKLPTGKLLKLTYQERLVAPEQAPRLRMHLSITPPQSKTFLPGTVYTIANGGTLLVAGDKLSDGTLVIAITCKD